MRYVLALIISFLSLAIIGFKSDSIALAVNFVVNSDNDVDDGICDGTHCSLREAVKAANSTSGTDTITFNIPGAGFHSIALSLALPTITDSVTIDATTQSGFVNSPIIELNGSNAGSGSDGLNITPGGSTVRGLIINRFGG